MVWYTKVIANEKFNDRLYDIVVNGSMQAYIVHYFWIVVVVNLVVLPYKMDFTAGVFTTFVGGEILILLFHFFIEFVMSMIKKKKNNKKRQIRSGERQKDEEDQSQ